MKNVCKVLGEGEKLDRFIQGYEECNDVRVDHMTGEEEGHVTTSRTHFLAGLSKERREENSERLVFISCASVLQLLSLITAWEGGLSYS